MPRESGASSNFPDYWEMAPANAASVSIRSSAFAGDDGYYYRPR
jgi:hypothetical protein